MAGGAEESMIKNAVVAGGASGIGRCAVERLLRDGCRVWALDNSAPGLERLAQDFAYSDRYAGIECDFADVEQVRTAFDQIAHHTDRLDALIYSAGVVTVGSLEELSPDQVDLMIDVNLRGPWLTIRQALALLRKEASQDNPTRIVIVGSIGGIRPKVGTGMYGATKAAAHVLVGIYAVELADSGITVNAVAPGTVDTPMARSVGGASVSSRFKPSGTSPLGRIARPDDVADAIAFFLGDTAKYINGTILPVDGGTRAAFVKA